MNEETSRRISAAQRTVEQRRREAENAMAKPWRSSGSAARDLAHVLSDLAIAIDAHERLMRDAWRSERKGATP